MLLIHLLHYIPLIHLQPTILSCTANPLNPYNPPIGLLIRLVLLVQPILIILLIHLIHFKIYLCLSQIPQIHLATKSYHTSHIHWEQRGAGGVNFNCEQAGKGLIISIKHYFLAIQTEGNTKNFSRRTYFLSNNYNP